MLMQNSKALKVILALCGLPLLAAGGLALFNTEYFAGRNGTEIAGDLSLYNDYMATGALFIGAAIIMLLGIIHHRMAFTSVVVAMVAHLSIALGRWMSIGMHGMPADNLFKASILETILGLIALFALIKFRDAENLPKHNVPSNPNSTSNSFQIRIRRHFFNIYKLKS